MNSDYEQIAKIINFLHQNPSNALEPDIIASKTGLSSNQFKQLFQDWAGITAKQFLHYLTADYLRQQLIKSNQPDNGSGSSSDSIKNNIYTIKTNKRNNNPSEQTLKILYGTILSPFGSAFIATIEDKICHLSFIDSQNPDKNINALRKKWPKAELSKSANHINQFSPAFLNNPDDTNYSLIVKGTEFQIKVWKFLLLIPRGTLYSYGQVAGAIGHPSASRAVANAIGANPIAYLIPCHRIVRSSGALGGYHWGIVCKQEILAWEFGKDFELNNNTAD